MMGEEPAEVAALGGSRGGEAYKRVNMPPAAKSPQKDSPIGRRRW